MSEYYLAPFDENWMWSVSMLAKALGKDRRTMSKAVKDCAPIGEYMGNPTYGLRDAAEAVFGKAYYTKEGDMKPADRKMYYESEKARVDLEEKLGQLIQTDAAHKFMAALFKDMDLSIAMISDEIERECGLNHEQYVSLERQLDKMRVKLSVAASEVS